MTNNYDFTPKSYPQKEYIPKGKMRKKDERDYKRLAKKVNKLNKKFEKLKNREIPDKVALNIIKARGQEILHKIDIVEKSLGVQGNDKIDASKFFIN